MTVLISISAYIALLIAISLFHRKKGNKANSEFLIADRKLSSTMSALSILASFVGGGTLLSNTSLIFKFGGWAFSFLIGLPLGVLLFMTIAPYIHKKAKEHKWLTLYDFFQDRFSKSTKNIVAILQIIAIILITCVAMIGGARMLQMFTGYSYLISVLLMALVVGVYLTISGFSSVVRTDAIQAIFLLVLFAGLFIFTNFTPSQITTYQEMNFTPMNPIICILMFTIACTYMFASEEMFQRVYATKKAKSVRKSLLIVFFMYSFFYVTLAGSVFKLKSIYPALEGDVAFLDGIKLILPISYQWLASIAILSVLLSTIDTYTFNGVLNINKLILDNKNKTANRVLAKRTRMGIPIFLAIVVFVSLYIQSVLHTTYIYAVIISTNALIVIASFLIKKLDKYHANFALITSATFMILFIAKLGFSEKMVILPFISVPLGFLMAYIYKIIKKMLYKLKTL